LSTLRAATVADIPAVRALIVRSSIELSAGFYTPEQAAAITEYVFGLDNQFLDDAPSHAIEPAHPDAEVSDVTAEGSDSTKLNQMSPKGSGCSMATSNRRISSSTARNRPISRAR